MPFPFVVEHNASQELYVRSLAAVLKSGPYIRDPDFALAKDPEIEEKLARDPIIGHAIAQRLHAVAGGDAAIEPGDDTAQAKQLAGIVDEAVDGIRSLAASRHELARACFNGRAYGYVEGRRRLARLGGKNAKPLHWWMPTRITDIDRRRIRFVNLGSTGQVDRATVKVVAEIFSIAKEQWVRMKPDAPIVSVVFDDRESRLGYGRGLMEAMYFYDYMKSKVLATGFSGLERWANGLVVGKIDHSDIGGLDATAKKARDGMMAVLQAMTSRHHVVIGKNDEINLHETSGTGNDMVFRFLDYLDQALVRLILGAVLPTGGGADKGSLARAEVEQGSTETLLQFDRDLQDEAMTRGVIEPFLRLNRGNLLALGLLDAKRPKFGSRSDPKGDAEAFARTTDVALRWGLAFRKEDVYRRLQMTPPTQGDEIIRLDPQEAPPGGPGSPGGGSGDGPDFGAGLSARIAIARATGGLRA